MAQWLAILVPIIAGAITAGVVFGIVQSGVSRHEVGQNQIFSAIKDLTATVATLTTNAAVNATQHEELSRRISAIEQMLGKHDEKIRVVSTRTHMHAQKIHEMDPAWKPYRGAGDGE